MKTLRLIIVLLTVLMLAACSETKYVAEGEYLLDRVKLMVEPKNPHVKPEEMKAFLRQRGNARWFSTVKIPLRTYSLSGRDTTRWINRTLRAIGEPPVLYDSLQTELSMQAIQQQMQNKGFLHSSVDVMNTVKGRKIVTTYVLHPDEPFYIRNVDYIIQDSAINSLLQLDSLENRGLHSGMMFNVENLDAERKRITQLLTNQGYYRFNKDYISFWADSVSGTHDIDLTLVLHRYRKGDIDNLPHARYSVGNVRFASGSVDDSVIHLRPKVLQNNTYIQESEPYSAADLQKTYNNFGRLGAVRYTNINFKERPDTTVLDCDIAISTNKPSSISFQPEGTNTAGDLGAAASLTYLNRNLFRGSESLTIELRAAFEAIKGLEGYSNSNFEEYSLQTKLSFPRFIAPFLNNRFGGRINTSSEVGLVYDLQNRPEFRRRVFSVSWRYKWNNPNRLDRYQFDVLDLNFVSMPWISETFRKEYLSDTGSRNSILMYNYMDLFIMKMGLGYSYNNGRYAIKTNVETSGNLLNALAHLFDFHRDSIGQYTVGNIAFAQYVKGDVDFTRNFQLAYNNQLVFHVGFGIAYPYGNSRILPFEKRYFSGGANSVRGWSVRTLGPGNYIRRSGTLDFINQTGDMKLDVNLEYRAHLFWKLGAALFVDVGNIWTLRNYDDQPGGQFKLNEFWNQLAAGYGLGFRFNFDYFIVRFDMGMKAVNPAYQNHREHFPIVYPKLSRDFAFHFAVGLPF
jgi:outer membrane protein assembly factor BamA